MFGIDDILGDVVGGAGNILSGGANQNSIDAYNKARGVLQNTNVQAGPSAYASADPATRAAQMSALGEMQNKYNSGGLDAIDRGRLGDINQNQNQAAATQRAAVQQDAARRGLMNSGNALVSAQVGGQQAVQQGSDQARNAASLAEQSRLAEVGQAGNMAGDIRGQDYQRAGAEDAISRFNAAQRLNQASGVAGIYAGQAGQYNNNANRNYGMVKDLARGASGSGWGTG